jgi:tripartite-type tricarboxylate transporter receptor subunit TctC
MRSKFRRGSTLRRAFVGSVLILVSGFASAQNYPSKPIRIVAPAPGGGADLVARIVAQGLTSGLREQAIVENRGGSAVIPAEIVLKSPPDGYTLLFAASAHWLLPLFQRDVPYDPVKDFAPITWTTTSPAIIAVHPSLPVKSLKELIALAKARPGEINCASGTKGSTTYLSAELFKYMARVNVAGIPYTGAGPALNATVAGHVQMIVITASSVMPFAKSGRLRALAVASASPSVLAPGLPTSAAAGLPGYESGTVHALFAPSKTPEPIITRLNQETVGYLTRPEIKDRMLGLGLDVIASTPAQLLATVKSEIARVGKMLSDSGIRPE